MSDFTLSPEIIAARAIQTAQANMLASVDDQTMVTTDQVQTVIVLTDYFKPLGALYETVPRYTNYGIGWNNANQQLILTGIGLPAGLTVSSITFGTIVVGGAAGTPVHQWFGLYDMAYNQLAVTADDTTNPWLTDDKKTLPIAVTAAGAVSSFTTTYAGLHYLGMVTDATSGPTLLAAAECMMWNTDPPLSILADFSLATPPAFPFTATRSQNVATILYGFVS